MSRSCRSYEWSRLRLMVSGPGPTAVVSFVGVLRLFRLRAAAAHVPACSVVVLGHLPNLLDRNHQADTLRRQDVSPVGDQLLVGLADVADLAVEVEQAERIDVAVLLPERGVPIDLVGQAVPGEPD